MSSQHLCQLIFSNSHCIYFFAVQSNIVSTVLNTTYIKTLILRLILWIYNNAGLSIFNSKVYHYFDYCHAQFNVSLPLFLFPMIDVNEQVKNKTVVSFST